MKTTKIKIYNLLFISFIIGSLTSCAAPVQRYALTNSAQTGIQSTRMLLNSTQREIVMQKVMSRSDVLDPYTRIDSGVIVQSSPDYSSGLIEGLIIDGIKQYQVKSGLTAIRPIRIALGDFDFFNNFNETLKSSVAKLPWLKVTKSEIKYNLDRLGSESKIVNSAKEQNTLFVGTTYAVNSSFRVLTVAAYVKLAQKSANTNAPRTLYANNFYFIYRLPEPNDNVVANESKWIRKNAALLKAKLNDAATMLTDAIVTDMSNTNAEAYNDNNVITVLKDGRKEKIKLLKNMNNYLLGMNDSKEIIIVNADDVVTR